MSLLEVGAVIGERYTIDAFIGEGGMQEVYRANDGSLGRVVALKAPKNNSARKRFQRSASLSAKVTHPNVAKTFDYIEGPNQQFLIEEYIPGEDLSRRLDQYFFNLDPHLAAHVFHHLAKGLAAVHREGVIHRDLKPSNIMVSADCDLSVLKITDFGIAKMAAAEIEEGMKDGTLASQTVVGAVPYMAPEVVRNRDDVGTSADIWSTGAILFHLLVGERPFGDGLAAVDRILSGAPPAKPPVLLSASGQMKQLSDELWQLILSCLRADPSARPNADALVVACDSLCYSRAPRAIGKIQTYKPKNGNWGFIDSDSYKDNTFFHLDSYWRADGSAPVEGQRVCFARFQGTPNPRARPVLRLRG